jgi:hypothetical protein
MSLVSLQEAAEALGYTVKGLRRIVARSRAKANGARTRGPTIKFFQAGKNAPIKFKAVWVEEFIKAHTVDPARGSSVPRIAAPLKESCGLDPELFTV